MYRRYIRGRSRILDPELKSKLCELVAESATIEEAAETLDVSLRTVQRERKGDEDFDHELRLALQAPPDPKKLMQNAARTHWRAAAWLLERTEPETYARKPANTAYAKQVAAALEAVVEAALEAVPPEMRQAVYRQVQAASEQALDCCFPNLGPWGHPRQLKHPLTPLTDQEFRTRWSDRSSYIQIIDDEGEPDESAPKRRRLTPEEYALKRDSAPSPARVAARQAEQKAAQAAAQQCRKSSSQAAPAPAASPTPATSDERLSWRFNLRTSQTTISPQSDEFSRLAEVDDGNDGILSPEIALATELEPNDWSDGAPPPTQAAD